MSNFTVKWVYDVDGVAHERLIEADQVNAAYDIRSPSDKPAVSRSLGVYHIPPNGVVVIGNPYDGGESMCLAHGKVYVMNRDGATVAKYRLADVPAEETSTAIPEGAAKKAA